MRVEIDHQDIIDLFGETERRRADAKTMLALSLGALALIAIGAGLVAWRSALSIAALQADAPVGDILSTFSAAPQPFLVLALSFAFVVLSIVVGAAILRQRRAERAIRRDELLKNRLISGRFDYIFAPDMLVIKGAQSIRKISWSNFSAIESAKKSILFKSKDGGVEFLPKNVLPNDQFGDALLAKHEALLNKPCPLELANGATPLSVTYESAPTDYDDFRRMRARRRDGRLHILRRIYLWPAWAPYLLFACLALSVASAIVAFRISSLHYGGMAIVFIGAAAIIFHRNTDYFRGPGFPFMKNGAWPYAQSDLVTVQLSRDGVRRARHGAVDLIRWSAFEGYVETRRFGYLVISPTIAIALPKRAFVSAAHFNDFRSRAKACIAGAKNEQAARKQQRLVGSLSGKSQAGAAKAAKTVAVADLRPAKKKAPASEASRPAKPSAA